MTLLDYFGNAMVIMCIVGFVVWLLGLGLFDGSDSGDWVRISGCGMVIVAIILLNVVSWLAGG